MLRFTVTEQFFTVVHDKTVIYFKVSLVVRKTNLTVFENNDETLIIFILFNCMAEQLFSTENTKFLNSVNRLTPWTIVVSRFIVVRSVSQLHV